MPSRRKISDPQPDPGFCPARRVQRSILYEKGRNEVRLRYKVHSKDRCPVCGRMNTSRRTQRNRLIRFFFPNTKRVKRLLCHSQYLVCRTPKDKTRRKMGFVYPKLCNWVEENIEETFTFYRWPLAHHKHLKSTNMLERVNEELNRRSHVIRIFPNPESCLRLMRALTMEIHEDWIEQHRYLNMELLREHKKLKLVQAA